MAFGCTFVSNFMMQAVVRSEPALRGRAVALIDGAAPVWSVVALNAEAAKAGIALGMSKSQVQQFFGIEIRHRSPARETAAHAALLDLGWSLSPRVEDTAPDAIVLDLAGLNSLLGSDESIAAQLAARASNLGLLPQIAVASKMETAIVAARGFEGITLIPEGREAEILGNLPVTALSPSLEVLETLDCWGVRTCAALAALPVVQLSERLGQEGVRLHELAQGKGERSMLLAEPALHFEEEMELEDAVEELEPLSFLLGRLLGQVCARLEARSLAACAVRVRFDLDASFEPDSAQSNCKSEPRSSQRKAEGHEEFHLLQRRRERGENKRNDTHSASSIYACSHAPRFVKSYERALSLPTPMRNPKTLLNLLRLHLQSDPPTAPIVKIMLSTEATRPRVVQGGLFLPSFPDPEKLELTIARLANVVGDSNIGSPELIGTHRPGGLRVRRFVAANGVENRRRNLDVKARAPKRGKSKSRWPSAGFRVFRPASPAKVDLRDGCPVRVGFQGMNGHVVAASGPWRSSGDWWREDGWQNDEWDLEVVFFSRCELRTNPTFDFQSSNGMARGETKDSWQRGFYRIFFDSICKEWFVRGSYD
jgi:protein ImuB